MPKSNDSTVLDLPLPARRHETLGLVMIRRLAGHGLSDARATMLALDAAGPRFRKLLLLTRTLVTELARSSRRKIYLAPCCAAGMTRDEGLIMSLIGGAGLDVSEALTDNTQPNTAIASAHALGEELSEIALARGWRR
ncbi:hypothetical protein K3162_12845 [Qipengyuania xiapuensis]|uniref:Uncharacterized protein n=1 Tax=Qipengyuania xiapuensis TaxID=2867236 RepID=A0ABX8ZW99_9SPHN|nr:DUF6628 family protein [Qipengyuania xiapuensis]QZD92404.1 hypothetical protein K3162_12845 [Qipengyuania xiapuensis]